jgi:DNA-binding PadR family transcriptional regulator
MPDDLPTDVEQQVLLAVWRLGEEAYGVPVRDELEEVAGRSVSASAVYSTLVRLERKGWIDSSMGDPTPERGGKAKRFFRITGTGKEALRTARETMDRLWAGVERPATSGGEG